MWIGGVIGECSGYTQLPRAVPLHPTWSCLALQQALLRLCYSSFVSTVIVEIPFPRSSRFRFHTEAVCVLRQWAGH